MLPIVRPRGTVLYHQINKLKIIKTRLYGTIFVAAFAIIGTVLLLASHASTPYASITADLGNLNGNACKISDSAASDGTAVQFGESCSGGGVSGSSNCVTDGQPGGDILFNGCNPSYWQSNQSAAANRTVLINDPVTGAGDNTTQVTALDSDVAPATPTDNPRAQLVSPNNIITNGSTYWVSFEVYLPPGTVYPPSAPSGSGFPAGGTNGWILLNETGYGAPYNGSPPIALDVGNGNFTLQRGGGDPSVTPYQIVWQSPLVRGQWVRFTFHVLHSTSGWFELYMNDVAQGLYDGTSQVPPSTGNPNQVVNSDFEYQLPLDYADNSDNTGPWSAYEQVYYKEGSIASLTVDYKGFTVATTQAAAEAPAN
jgi:hypothetical protein